MCTPEVEKSWCHTASYTCAVAAIAALHGEDVSWLGGCGLRRALVHRAGAVADEDPRRRRGPRLADRAGGGAEAPRGRVDLGGAHHTEQLLHGHLAAIDETVRAYVLEGEGRAGERARDAAAALRELGCETTLVPTQHPVVDIVRFHLLTLALAESKGIDPDPIHRDDPRWARRGRRTANRCAASGRRRRRARGARSRATRRGRGRGSPASATITKRSAPWRSAARRDASTTSRSRCRGGGTRARSRPAGSAAAGRHDDAAARRRPPVSGSSGDVPGAAPCAEEPAAIGEPRAGEVAVRAPRRALRPGSATWSSTTASHSSASAPSAGSSARTSTSRLSRACGGRAARRRGRRSPRCRSRARRTPRAPRPRRRPRDPRRSVRCSTRGSSANARRTAPPSAARRPAAARGRRARRLPQ